MNIRSPVDYSAMFAALDTLMAIDLPQKFKLQREDFTATAPALAQRATPPPTGLHHSFR